MGASAVATLLLGIVPLDMPVREQVGVIEVNHYYDDQAHHVFDQFIFRDFNPYTNNFEIVDWRLKKPEHCGPDGCSVFFYDNGIMRRVDAGRVNESWTQIDPELNERSILPKEQRRGLSPVMSAKRAKELYKER